MTPPAVAFRSALLCSLPTTIEVLSAVGTVAALALLWAAPLLAFPAVLLTIGGIFLTEEMAVVRLVKKNGDCPHGLRIQTKFQKLLAKIV